MARRTTRNTSRSISACYTRDSDMAKTAKKSAKKPAKKAAKKSVKKAAKKATKKPAKKKAAASPRAGARKPGARKSTRSSRSSTAASTGTDQSTPQPAPAKTGSGTTGSGKSGSGKGGKVKGMIRVRMYRIGFGDFFLLTVPTQAQAGPAHILIDCGVHAANIGTMGDCFNDLAKETGGKLALVIATHFHADHLSGFASNYADFAKFEVGAVWITNRLDPGNSDASKFHA